MKTADKNFDAGIRILEILQLLSDKGLTRKELIEELKLSSDVDKIYTPEALIKYFNAFESLGLKLGKYGVRYEFKNAFQKLSLSKEEINAFVLLLSNYKNLHDKDSKEIVGEIAHKFNKYFDFDTDELFAKIVYQKERAESKKQRDNILQTLENMMYDKQNVVIVYQKNSNTTEEILAELKQIGERGERYVVSCYLPAEGKNRRLYVDKILKLEQLPQKNAEVNFLNSVVFEVTGRLALSYKLKESEKVIDFSKTHLTISNTAEDKEALLRRLLKYGENCKIIKPEEVKEEFIELTDKILENLEAL